MIQDVSAVVLVMTLLILLTDVNECEEYGRCSQTCVNTKGSYKCGCVDGYVLVGNLERCKAEG